MNLLDSGFRRNDVFKSFSTFYESIKVQGSKVVFTASPPAKVARLLKFYGGPGCRGKVRLAGKYRGQVFNSIDRKFGKRKVTLNGEPKTCERL